MVFKLENVVPWGRNFEEYQRMFALTPADLSGRIAGCADGPASFNAEATAQGIQVTSFDPIYAFTAEQIQARVEEIAPGVVAETWRNQHLFKWEIFASPDELGAARLAAMRRFIADYEQGKERYIPASLPNLPAPDRAFDLALCSHFLFLYADHFDFEFHLAAVRELCRIAAEVRIFPLHDLANQPACHLEPVIAALEGYVVEKVTVPYEFRHGDHFMLRIKGA